MLIAIHSSASAQTATLDSLKNLAAQEHKSILLYFSGSDWCAPCIKFKKNFITQPAFQQFAQENLVIYNADFPRRKINQLSRQQTLANEQLAERYNRSGIFPYIVLLTADGKVTKQWDSIPTGTVSDFIQQLKD